MKAPRFWQSNNRISSLLLPASWLYRLGAWFDRTCTTPAAAPIPIIAIGNAVAGGAGKTPTTIALAPLLAALGHQPHILSRGYGSQASDTPHRVTSNDSWQQVGDEALLLQHAAPTWVSRHRFAAAQAATSAGATIALCDDALQHHRLKKDISFLVLDGAYGIGNGRLLPAGPLREPFPSALRRSDAVILIGEDTKNLTANCPLPVFRAELIPAIDTAFLKAQPWLAFAGIGRPEKFFTSLRKAGATLAATRNFPDHHPYSAADIAALITEASKLGARLITTEKDWVKLPPEIQKHVAVLPVTLHWNDPQTLTEFLRTRLATYKQP